MEIIAAIDEDKRDAAAARERRQSTNPPNPHPERQPFRPRANLQLDIPPAIDHALAGALRPVETTKIAANLFTTLTAPIGLSARAPALLELHTKYNDLR